MIKRKSALTKLVLAIFSVVLLTGCLFGNGTGGGGGGVTPTPKPTPTPTPTPKQVSKNIGAVFSQATYTYTNEIHNFEGSDLDEYFDVLAKDLLYRLVSVYGMGVRFIDNDIRSDVKIDRAKVITNNLVDPFARFYDLSKAENYKVFYGDGRWNLSNGAVQGVIYHLDAIEGGYLYGGNSSFATPTTDDFENMSMAWNYNYSSAGIRYININLNTSPQDYINFYLSSFKQGLANAIAGTNDFSYNSALAEINHKGFNAADKQKIINFIYNEVIGTENVNYDETAKNFIINTIGSLVVGVDNLEQLRGEIANFYRGYKVLVPALVDQALNMKTTSDDAVYPTTVTNKSVTENKTSTITATIGSSAINLPANQISKVVLKSRSSAKLHSITLKTNRIQSNSIRVRYRLGNGAWSSATYLNAMGTNNIVFNSAGVNITSATNIEFEFTSSNDTDFSITLEKPIVIE